MSMNAISLPVISAGQQPIDFRLRARQPEESSCFSTAMKVAGFASVIIAAGIAFAVAGPIVALVIALVGGAALLTLFTSCCGDSEHTHTGRPPLNPQPPINPRPPLPPINPRSPLPQQPIPWHQRIFSWFPQRSSPHVRVGGGHMNDGRVPVGGGHLGRGGNLPPPGGPGGHVPVGGGHRGGGHAGGPRRNLPPPGGPGDVHVPVGGVHRGHGGGQGAVSSAHVPVGHRTNIN